MKNKFVTVILLVFVVTFSFVIFNNVQAQLTQIQGDFDFTNTNYIYNLKGLSIGTGTTVDGGIRFPDGTVQTSAAGDEATEISAAQVTQGTFGSAFAGSNNQYIFRPATNTTSVLRVNNAAGTVIFNVDASNQRVGIGTTSPSQKLDVAGNIRLGGSTLVGTGSSGTYGSVSISGSKNSYSGIHFPSTSPGSVFMVRNSDGLAGMWRHSGGWSWYFSGSGVLTAGSVPWARLTNHVSVSSGTGLTGGGALSSSRTLSLDTGYTDGRYVNKTGDTMTGILRLNANSIYYRQDSTSTWGGNTGTGWGKLEYHSNRWYINAGSDSAQVAVFRRGGSNVFIIDNSGTVVQGTIPWARLSGHVSVSSGTGITGGGALSSSRTLSLDTGYTDGRYVNKAGDTMTGNLWFSGTRYIGTSTADDFYIRAHGGNRIRIRSGDIRVYRHLYPVDNDVRYLGHDTLRWNRIYVNRIYGSGITNSVTDTSTVRAASAAAVKSANDNANNRLSRATNTWITSADGHSRFYFANGSHTYLRTASNMYFRTGGDTTRMTILSNGNVGIGTTGPGAKLDVGGDVRGAYGAGGNFESWEYLGTMSGGELDRADHVILLARTGNVSGANNSVFGQIYGKRVSGHRSSGILTITLNQTSAGIPYGMVYGSLIQDIHTARLVTATYNGDSYVALELISSANYQAWTNGVWFRGNAMSTGERLRILTRSQVSNINPSGVNSQARFIVDNANVGIGTTSPQATLHVNGFARGNYTVPTSDYHFAPKWYVDDVSGAGLTGSGTANYVARWTGSTSLANSVIQDNGTRVGIGTSPHSSYRLNVSGDILNTGWIRTSGTSGLYFQSYGGGWYMTDSTWIRTYGNKSIYHNTGTLRTDGTFQVGPSGNRFVVTSGGNVGIGTTSPNDALLDVFSTGNLPDGNALKLESSGDQVHVGMEFRQGGESWQLTKRNPWNDNKFMIAHRVPGVSFNPSMTFLTNGNVGIGTESPSERLDIDGKLRVRNHIDLTGGNRIITATNGYAMFRSTNSHTYIRSAGTSHHIYFQAGSTTRFLIHGSSYIRSYLRHRFADGSVGSPSITFASDTNTGIYRPASNTIGFSTSGTEAMRIDGNNDVVIQGCIVFASGGKICSN